MPQVQITDLPQALPLAGTESVPIVQNGVTVQTTTGAIAGAGALNYPFLTVGSTAGLTQARYLSVGTGLSLSDNGAGSTLQVNLTGASLSLDSSGTGLIVKTGPNTVTGRSLAVGAGLSIANGDGVSGNPTVSLGDFLNHFVSLTGTGVLAIQSGTVGKINVLGTSNQTTVLNGNGSADIVVGLASNPVLPGTGAVTIPSGTSAQQPAGTPGMIRYNTTTGEYDGYIPGGWKQFAMAADVLTFSAGTTGFLPDTPTSGSVVLSGILNPASGGTGVNNGTYTTTLGGNISTAGSFTTSGAFSLALTATGATNVTLPTTGTLATLAGSETLTNKTISGSNNTLTDIGNASLTNSAVTIGTTSISLGSSSTTLSGLTTVTLTQNPTLPFEAATKQYVDNVAQGLNVKAAALWGTTGNITLSGLSTQAGGEWTGSLTAGDRILVKSQTAPEENGIYAAAAGAWTRTADANTWDELISAFVFIQQGATLADTGWVCTVDPGGTLGVTPVTWTQFSGAGTYTAGNGLQLIGTQFSAKANGTTLDISSSGIKISDTYPGQTSITTLGTITTGTWNGTTIAVLNGGTGATTASGARTNLGAAASGINSDITSLTGITNGISTPDYIDFHVNSGATSAVGRVFWDGGTTLNVGMTANVTGKALEDSYYYIKASSAITKGQVIMFTGAVGASGVPTGAPATGVTDGSYIMGIAAENIANNAFGLVQYLGTLRGIDTSAYADGDILWYDPSVVGGLTKTKPTSPNVKVQMCAVVSAGNNGAILIRVSAGSVLGGTDSNVQFGTLSNLDVIQYDSTAGYWKNVAATSLSVGSATNATNATNTGITADSTNATRYLTFVSGTTGNLPQLVNSGVTVSPSTASITGGVRGGSF